VTSYITYPAVSVPGQQFLDPDPDAAIAISVAQRSCAKLMYFGLDILLFCPTFAHVKLQHKEQRKHARFPTDLIRYIYHLRRTIFVQP